MKELVKIQSQLIAPKNQRNTFGKYNYRSCEDILEALKPLLKKEDCHLVISDEIFMAGHRIYIKATATITNSKGDKVVNTAYARESETKKGMDESQITGACSSYARKYALNGLFLIDDSKDADTMDNATQVTSNLINDEQVKRLYSLNADKNFIQSVYVQFGYSSAKHITQQHYNSICEAITGGAVFQNQQPQPKVF